MDLWKVKHPWYKEMEEYWDKYRFTYEGGRKFILKYPEEILKA
jgi:hypothetical protein